MFKPDGAEHTLGVEEAECVWGRWVSESVMHGSDQVDQPWLMTSWVVSGHGHNHVSIEGTRLISKMIQVSKHPAFAQKYHTLFLW